MNLRHVIAITLLGLLAGCSLPHSDMKSPCVGAQGSPCDPHPVNDWWLKERDQKS